MKMTSNDFAVARTTDREGYQWRDLAPHLRETANVSLPFHIARKIA